MFVSACSFVNVLGTIISKTAGHRDSVTMEHLRKWHMVIGESNGHVTNDVKVMTQIV